MWVCSEEKIEFSGALGKADVSNRMLDDIERDLEELWAANQLDSFCLYVYGLVLADRCVLLKMHASTCCASLALSDLIACSGLFHQCVAIGIAYTSEL